MTNLSRRTLLASLAGMSGAVSLVACVGSPRTATKRIPPLGIQLYMLGEEAGKDLARTFQTLAEIGYREVELPHFYNRPAGQIRAALDTAGLVCPSIHAPLRALFPGMPTLEQASLIIDMAQTVGARHVVVPIFPLSATQRINKNPLNAIADAGHAMTLDDWNAIADQLNKKGALLARSELRIGYHNHNIEFATLPDGRTPFEVLVEKTDSALVNFEIDVGWVAAAGLDPVAMIERHARRIRQLHIKDIAPTPANTALQLNPADIGAGVIDWAALLIAAKRAKIEHYYVEQEPPFISSRINAAVAAYTFLANMFSSGLHDDVAFDAASTIGGPAETRTSNRLEAQELRFKTCRTEASSSPKWEPLGSGRDAHRIDFQPIGASARYISKAADRI